MVTKQLQQFQYLYLNIMIRFGKTTLDDSVKEWSYEKLERVFKGKIDYVSLAKQLGITPTKIKEVEPEVENVENEVKPVEFKKSTKSRKGY